MNTLATASPVNVRVSAFSIVKGPYGWLVTKGNVPVPSPIVPLVAAVTTRIRGIRRFGDTRSPPKNAVHVVVRADKVDAMAAAKVVPVAQSKIRGLEWAVCPVPVCISLLSEKRLDRGQATAYNYGMESYRITLGGQSFWVGNRPRLEGPPKQTKKPKSPVVAHVEAAEALQREQASRVSLLAGLTFASSPTNMLRPMWPWYTHYTRGDRLRIRMKRSWRGPLSQETEDVGA